MNCAWLKERLPRPEVELWRYGRPSAVLLEHARTCTECAQTIESEARVKALLLGLSETTQGVEPSPHVHARLMKEVEERAQLQLVPEPRWPWLRRVGLRWALATAAGAAAAALVLYGTAGQEQRVSPPAPPVAANAPTPAPKQAQPTRPADRPAPQVSVAAKKAANPASSGQETPRAAETYDEVSGFREQEYYPLVMCDAYSCQGDAVEVRVTVPAPRLWLSGASRPSQNVDAQLVVGEDGVVRAIKFVE